MAGPSRLPRPIGHSRSLDEAIRTLRGWRDDVQLCRQGQPREDDPYQIALADTLERFQIPLTPWIDLEQGLIAISRGEPVRHVPDFITRARQLTVAPAAAFFRVLCARRGMRRYRMTGDLEVDELAHDPGVFAYTVGVMGDVFTELRMFHGRRTSIPEELLQRHALDTERLAAIADLRVAPVNFRNLMRDLALIAWTLYEGGVTKLTQAAANLPPGSIEHLDGYLLHYRGVLRNLELAEYAPAAFRAVAGGLEPRIASRAEAGGDPESGEFPRPGR
jgi:phytoene/squalene synthetase